MYDILLVSAVAQLAYPFIALYAWYKVKKHEAAKEKKASERDHRINGRMDELLQAKEALAYERGKQDGIAAAMTAKLNREEI